MRSARRFVTWLSGTDGTARQRRASDGRHPARAMAGPAPPRWRWRERVGRRLLAVEGPENPGTREQHISARDLLPVKAARHALALERSRRRRHGTEGAGRPLGRHGPSGESVACNDDVARVADP